MIKFEKKDIEVYHVISEPGDMTRYDFVVYPYFDEFIIAPFKSTFRFPQKLNKWTIKSVIYDYENKDIELELAARMLSDITDINPHTVVQVARAIYRIFEDENMKI